MLARRLAAPGPLPPAVPRRRDAGGARRPATDDATDRDDHDDHDAPTTPTTTSDDHDDRDDRRRRPTLDHDAPRPRPDVARCPAARRPSSSLDVPTSTSSTSSTSRRRRRAEPLSGRDVSAVRGGPAHRGGHPDDHLARAAARVVAKLSRTKPAPGGPQRAPSTSTTPASLGEEVGHRLGQAERPAVEPRQVRALGRRVADLGQVLGEQLGEQPAVAVEVGEDVVEPRPARRRRRRCWRSRRASRRRGWRSVRARPAAPRSASLVRISWAHFRPGRFHAFDADVAVTVWPAVTSDSDAYGTCWWPGKTSGAWISSAKTRPPWRSTTSAMASSSVALHHPAERVVRVAQHEQLAAGGERPGRARRGRRRSGRRRGPSRPGSSGGRGGRAPSGTACRRASGRMTGEPGGEKCSMATSRPLMTSGSGRMRSGVDGPAVDVGLPRRARLLHRRRRSPAGGSRRASGRRRRAARR